MCLMSPARPLLLALWAILSIPELASAQEPGRRYPTARPENTIFSPMDLPAPNGVRTADGRPGPDYWQQEADYVIDTNLDPATRTVSATATITYTNHSPHDLPYLWLHLEQNIFREGSLGSIIGDAADLGLTETQGDGYTIHSISHAGGDLEMQVYDTLGRIHLPEPVAAQGGVFTFDISWDFVIPEEVFLRFGIADFDDGKVYEVAQWIPALAVYDDVHGWNTLPYLGAGEFYTNFGDYKVSITVPRDFLVVATGMLQNEAEVYTQEQVERLSRAKQGEETIIIRGADEIGQGDRPEGNGPLTWVFEAEDVRTFAWACSPIFQLDAASIDGVFLQSAYPKDGLPVWGDSTQMMRKAIAGYNERFYPYPYPAATNVYGAEGGMEYPMIIFCRGERERKVYGVTTHEIGHMYFPMLVNTDERRHAWMDEGFNTFLGGYSTEDWFGPQKQNENDPGAFAPLMTFHGQMPIATRPDALPSMWLGLLQYQKTGVGLTLLRESVLGPERFDYAFRTYVERWAFKSPQPADFFRCMEDAAGVDLAWFWRGWFYETGTLDQKVGEVLQPGRRRGARIRLENLGGLVMPVHVGVAYEDGTTEILELPAEVWYQSNSITHILPHLKRVTKVVIDPKRRFPDVQRKNNRWEAAAVEEAEEAIPMED